jgi:MFS family permease
MVASLTGDYFPAAYRGRLYGLILGGQVVGAGLGLVVSGDISSIVSWRYAFWWLAVPSLLLAWVVWRMPEPARGGRSRPVPAGPAPVPVTVGGPGADADPAADQDAVAGDARCTGPATTSGPDVNLAYEAARRAGAQPRSELVLDADPTENSLWWAIRYVLRVRTNIVIILASSLGYFYFAGLRSFAVLYATEHYRVSKPIATAMIAVVGLGAVIGVLAGGRVNRPDAAAGRHPGPRAGPRGLPVHRAARAGPGHRDPLAGDRGSIADRRRPAAARTRTADGRGPAGHHASRLWGRSEAVRTVFLTAAESFAPTVFGVLSQYGFGTGSSSSGGSHGTGLEYTFHVMLVLLFAAGFLSLSALRSYPRDVATASASVDAIARAADRS